MDLSSHKIILSKKGKIAGLITVCCLFLLTAAFCHKQGSKTYDYAFDLAETDMKTASYEDGFIRAEASGDDYSLATKPFILPAGDYIIELSYSADVPSVMAVQGNNDCVFDMELSETGGEQRTVFDDRLRLPNGTDRGKLKLYLQEEGPVCIYNIVIHSVVHIYRDYHFITALAFLISVILMICIIKFNDFKLSGAEYGYLAVLAAVFLVINIPYLKMGMLYNIDTQAHLKRIEGIMQGIRDKQLPVVIGPNYANQYGELEVLNPDLFLYIPALLRLLNVSVPTAYNFYMILVNLAAAVSALVCAQRLFGSIRWGIAASVVYLAEPFRLYVMLKLGAGAGMGTAMIFLPFVITGIYEVLFHKGSRWKYLAVGLWGIACSHVMSLAMALIFVLIYTVVNIKKLKEKEVFSSIIKAVVLFTVLSAGTLAPFLGYYFKGFNRAALEWTDFYHFPVEPARELMNLSALLLLIISCIRLGRAGRLSGFLKHFTICGILIIWMASPLFPWSIPGKLPFIDSFLSMMQYPFRFHLIAAPFVSIVTAACLCSVMDDRKMNLPGWQAWGKVCVVSVSFLLVSGIALNLYLHYGSDILFGDPVSGEINTVMEDYLPEGTLSEWYATDTGDFSNYETIQAYSYEKNYTDIDLTYTCSSEREYMEFPLFYYDGYTAYDQNGKPLKTEKGEKNRVRVYLTRSEEIQELHVRFVVNKLYKTLFLLSVIAGALWFAWNIGYFAFRALRSGRILEKKKK
ncbi:MAG: hypothetical protein K5770_20205 [Lachnospiraceae bacterium]|nr:hypothetical protein [Lachnospiraceae bacterium]